MCITYILCIIICMTVKYLVSHCHHFLSSHSHIHMQQQQYL